ncbi:uncharacterized protein [Gorilla gorilla gorilla]|uniref:uncharacterized protein isoform X2 n=1 Tax=Gorilla gorilla gorilla TaxID=9595 RepID=UPI002445D697|nr:uncharacterized protein LOC101128836 isoform X2 [Gorilla gorilla gorilla]
MGAHLGRTGAGRANLQGNEERAEGLRLPEGFGPIRLRLPGAPALLRPETLAALGQTGPTFPRHPRVSAAHSAHASQSVLGRSGPLPVCACASTIAVPEFSASCCALLSVQRWDGLFFFRFSAVVGVWQEFEGAKKGIGNVKREDSTCAKHIPRIGPRLGDAEWALRRALQPWEWTPAQAEGQGLAGWGLCAWAELKGSVLQISTRAQLSGRGRGEQLRTIVFLTQTHPARWKPGWRADGLLKVIIPENLTMEKVVEKNPLVKLGGQYQPPDCWVQHHTVVVVPYCGQNQHLKYLLFHLHPFLQCQQLHYAII